MRLIIFHSAFDVIMKNGIHDKGKLLTKISVFWFKYLKETAQIQNHLITADFNEMPPVVQQYRKEFEGRAMLVKKLRILPVEAIVRGYITGTYMKCVHFSGSAMAEYRAKGTVCDIPLPKGLVESQKLDMPLFTPSTKAALGDHGIFNETTSLICY
jgi:phosphoribosylaminoimidazole-succinocarboxamide synthase